MPALKPELPSFSPPRLLCLGRAVSQKGFDLALAAFARLVPRFPGIRLTIGGDGKEKPSLEAMAHQLGVANSVEFRGWVQPEHVPELLSSHTLVLMPSRFEPFGIVALQAAQMARPVVATRVGGLPEVVAAGETGLLVENGDVDGLVKAITVLLDDPERAVRMGQAARQRAQEKFSWDNFVDSYDSLYRRLLARQRGRRD
jgi:glycogen(starch) synthase